MAIKDTPQVIANREHLRVAEKNKRRLIVVSVLAGWSEAGEARLQAMLPLGLFSGFPDLVMPEDVRHRLERSFSRELGDWRRGMKVMVIAETEPPETSFRHIDGRNRPSSRSAVIDVALMTVSPRFIPLDSGYESAVEEKLWQEKRAFIKSLRYDGEEDVFPDFVLKDVPCVDALPMEVFGMNTPEYLLRMQEKTSYYERNMGPGIGGPGTLQRSQICRHFLPSETGVVYPQGDAAELPYLVILSLTVRLSGLNAGGIV